MSNISHVIPVRSDEIFCLIFPSHIESHLVSMGYKIIGLIIKDKILCSDFKIRGKSFDGGFQEVVVKVYKYLIMNTSSWDIL